jgi:hypothetical protein
MGAAVVVTKVMSMSTGRRWMVSKMIQRSRGLLSSANQSWRDVARGQSLSHAGTSGERPRVSSSTSTLTMYMTITATSDCSGGHTSAVPASRGTRWLLFEASIWDDVRAGRPKVTLPSIDSRYVGRRLSIMSG